MTLTRQLPLRYLKPLALRLAFLDAFPTDPISDGTASTADELDTVISSIDARLANHPKTLRDADSLETALRGIAVDTLAEFDEHARKFPHGLGDPLRRFQAMINGVSCSACAAQASARASVPAHECRGNDDDGNAIAVEYGGHCIQPIMRVCATAREIASEYYLRFAPHAPRYHVRIATQWVNEGDTNDNFPDDIHAWAAADLRHDTSFLELNLKPKHLDRKTYQSLLYIVLHECICHVYQGSLDVTGARAVIGNADVFGEGWMDFVTHFIFTQVLAQDGPFGDRWADVLPDDPDCEIRGSEIHHYRTDSERVGMSPRLHLGVTSARNLQAALRRLLTPARAEEVFLELSLRINALPLPGSQREQLVTNVRAIFGSQRAADRASAEDLLQDCLQTGHTAEAFVSRCLKWAFE